MRTVAFAALVASAAAFAPALSGVRTGATSLNMAMDKSGRAPVVTVFDHRGCTSHSNVEYTGEPAKRADAKDKKFQYNGEDEMLVRDEPFGLP